MVSTSRSPTSGAEHLGLQVVGRDLRAGDEDAVFAGVGGFDPAVEEKRDVRVLFGLGQPGLLQARCREDLSQRVRQGLRREGDVHMHR